MIILWVGIPTVISNCLVITNHLISNHCLGGKVSFRINVHGPLKQCVQRHKLLSRIATAAKHTLSSLAKISDLSFNFFMLSMILLRAPVVTSWGEKKKHFPFNLVSNRIP